VIVEEVFDITSRKDLIVISARVKNEQLYIGDILTDGSSHWKLVSIAASRVKDPFDERGGLYGLSIRPIEHQNKLELGTVLSKVSFN